MAQIVQFSSFSHQKLLTHQIKHSGYKAKKFFLKKNPAIVYLKLASPYQ